MAKCSYCGNELKAGSKFCTECGAPAPQESPFDFAEAPKAPDPGPVYSQQASQPYYETPVFHGALPKKVGFGEAISRFFKNYSDFRGRANRSEYWYVILANLIVTWLLGVFFPGKNDVSFVSVVYSLVVLIPGLSLFVRRLHDIGRHWTRMLIAFVPLVGEIILIFDMLKDSDGDNAWGPCAKTCEARGFYNS